jgi:hypothetical protein
MDEEATAQMRQRLTELKSEHRDLDEVIARLAEQGSQDQLLVSRLKKRKLMLKDQISAVENALVPDIIA